MTHGPLGEKKILSGIQNLGIWLYKTEIFSFTLCRERGRREEELGGKQTLSTGTQVPGI